MRKRLCSAELAIFLAIWLGLMLAGRSRLFGDPGTLWHVVVGQRILGTARLINADPFTFTYEGVPWIAQQWLGECTMAWLHYLGGFDALLLATAVALAALFTSIACRLVRCGGSWPLGILLAVLTLLGSAYHLHVRPHLVNILFLAWTFGALCDFEAGRISCRRLFWLVPVFLIWTNIHGGVLGGLGTLFLVGAGWFIASVCGQPTPFKSKQDTLSFAALLCACGCTVFLNPYGLELPRVWLSLIGSTVLPQLMKEHAPLVDAGRSGWAVLLLGLVYLSALLGTLPMRPRITWLIPLVWLYLAWTRIRHGPLFAVSAGIALAEMASSVRWVAWLSDRGSHVFHLRSGDAVARAVCPLRVWGPLALVLPGLALICQFSSVEAAVIGRNWVKLEPTHWPTELLPDLQAYARDKSKSGRVFNDMLFGGFLIYFTPTVRIFIDDRCELYGDDGLLAYAHAVEEDPGMFDCWEAQYGFDLALVTPGSTFDRHVGGKLGWELVKSTVAANLFRRTGERCEREERSKIETGKVSRELPASRAFGIVTEQTSNGGIYR